MLSASDEFPFLERFKTWVTPLVCSLLLSLLLAQTGVAGANRESQKAETDWNVSEPSFSVPPRQIAINVRRGTWMSLDVSPDGKEIAFDLLGDIYLLPIEGGEARNISPGFHWDMQPRFSPDGTRIAFTSDRDGGDNIWIMDRDGSNSRQISREGFRLTNNPAWSPDGNYLAARKHFTTQRSLGTGEIWLYHLEGGEGVPAIERPNKRFQKELGEPAFSPDGKAIYYSQNVTPGDRFIYAQDSNKETFRIRKLLLETGEILDVAGGPGGAVRPTLSPDGRQLAFVRRVRAQSRLFLKDLTTGEERLLVDRLDYDMQETWGVHGVYPNFSFTPDSSSLVFWSGGELHRVEVSTGKTATIPFSIRDQRTLYDPPRVKIRAGMDEFDTRMPRWAQKIPGTDKILFESLGRLHVTDGEAPPVRLVRGDAEVFEVYPTVSADGRWVYFVAWNDERLGQIMRVSARGGKAKAVSQTRGHYREMSVSPDGKTLVYRQSAGGYLLHDARSHEPGIYAMPASGGSPRLIARDGQDAHFAGSSDRLFLLRADGSAEEGGSPPRKLVSITLDGGHPRDLAGARFPTEMRISPDGRYLAFVENYHAYVTPLPRTGKLVPLGAAAGNLPVRRLSSVGATFLHWVDNGTVGWSIGPIYKSAGLAQIYAEDFEPVEEGIDLSMKVQADKPAGELLLTGARIVTLGDQGVIEDGEIHIRDNRIVATGRNLQAPDASRLDFSGKTIVPGFIDAHAHGPYAQEWIVPQQNWSALGHLALGVTTVHDPSSEAVNVFAAAEYAKAGRILAPRTYSTGEIIYGAKSYRWASIDSLEDALTHVRRLRMQGAISVKNYNQPRRDQRQQVVEAARQEGMLVVAEGGALYHMDLSLVADGNTGIEHSLPQLAIYDDVVAFWSGTHVGYTPTLVVGYGTIEGEKYWYLHDDVWKHPLLQNYVPPRLLQARAVRRIKAPEEDFRQFDNAKMGKQLADAGVLVSTGAHGQREGLATHWEMWTFVKGGMTSHEALRAATLAPARYLGMDQDLGSLEAGKLADLVVIDGDVTRDIRVSDRITHVMLNGRLYDAATLSEQHTGDARLRPFYWSGRPESQIR